MFFENRTAAFANIAAALRPGGSLAVLAWQDVRKIVDWVGEHWDDLDEGVWETRGGQQKFTYSRLMTWVAVERAIRIARQRGLPAHMARWLDVRDSIYDQIMTQGWHEDRQYVLNRSLAVKSWVVEGILEDLFQIKKPLDASTESWCQIRKSSGKV